MKKYNIGLSTVIAGILSILTFIGGFVVLISHPLSAIVLFVAGLVIFPFLFAKIEKKINIHLSAALRWVVWFVLVFFVSLLLR